MKSKSLAFVENENLLSDAARQLLAAVSLWKVQSSPVILTVDWRGGLGYPMLRLETNMVVCKSPIHTGTSHVSSSFTLYSV